jgi:prepilin signal peptidase PulO-like enzyme (type II secretory pathway)
MAAAILDVSLLAVLAVVTVTDLRTRLVPNRVLLAGTAIGLATVAFSQPGELPERLACALGAGGFLLATAQIRPGGMGLGDVKLAAVLGLYLGPAVVTALLAAFGAGALAGAAIVIAAGWEARSRAIPFAPFLALGGFVAL